VPITASNVSDGTEQNNYASQNQSRKHSAVTSQTQISVTRSLNPQQTIVPIQPAQRECCPADVGSNELRPNHRPCPRAVSLFRFFVCMKS